MCAQTTANIPESQTITQLTPLFERQFALYAYGNSSLPKETAQALMEGIRYTVALGESSSNIQARFEAGQRHIDKLLCKCHTLLAGIQKTALDTENLSYRDTLAALPRFFKHYDKRFFPQDIPCDIDYQVAMPIPEHPEGVLWFSQYLSSLLLENQFCAKFDQSQAERLLYGAYPTLRDELVNLYTPLLCTALANVLLERNPLLLATSDADRANLWARLSPLDTQELREELLSACDELHSIVYTNQPALLAYMQKTVLHYSGGIAQSIRSERLESLFPSPSGPPPEIPQFADGPPMPANKLRSMIDELQDCRYTSDKLAVLKRDVHNLQDFTDILDHCFSKDESAAAFALLGKGEISELQIRLASKREMQDLPRWGELLGEYLTH